jgi:hypothetical protein
LNHEEHEGHEEGQARLLSPHPAGELPRYDKVLLLFVLFVVNFLMMSRR